MDLPPYANAPAGNPPDFPGGVNMADIMGPDWKPTAAPAYGQMGLNENGEILAEASVAQEPATPSDAPTPGEAAAHQMASPPNPFATPGRDAGAQNRFSFVIGHYTQQNGDQQAAEPTGAADDKDWHAKLTEEDPNQTPTPVIHLDTQRSELAPYTVSDGQAKPTVPKHEDAEETAAERTRKRQRVSPPSHEQPRQQARAVSQAYTAPPARTIQPPRQQPQAPKVEPLVLQTVPAPLMHPPIPSFSDDQLYRLAQFMHQVAAARSMLPEPLGAAGVAAHPMPDAMTAAAVTYGHPAPMGNPEMDPARDPEAAPARDPDPTPAPAPALAEDPFGQGRRDPEPALRGDPPPGYYAPLPAAADPGVNHAGAVPCAMDVDLPPLSIDCLPLAPPNPYGTFADGSRWLAGGHGDLNPDFDDAQRTPPMGNFVDGNARAKDLNESKMLEVTMEPDYLFPLRHLRGPFDLQRGLDQEDVRDWNKEPAGTRLAIEPFATPRLDSVEKAQAHGAKIRKLLLRITLENGFYLTTPRVLGPNEADDAGVILSSGWSREAAHVLLTGNKGVWSTPIGTIRVSDVLVSVPDFLFGYEFENTAQRPLGRGEIEAGLRHPKFRQTFPKLLEDLGSPLAAPERETSRQNFITAVLLTIHVDIVDFGPRVNSRPNKMIANVYCSPLTKSPTHWESWRRRMAEVPFSTPNHGAAKVRRETRCTGCSGADHPPHLCPFIRVPGWHHKEPLRNDNAAPAPTAAPASAPASQMPPQPEAGSAPVVPRASLMDSIHAPATVNQPRAQTQHLPTAAPQTMHTSTHAATLPAPPVPAAVTEAPSVPGPVPSCPCTAGGHPGAPDRAAAAQTAPPPTGPAATRGDGGGRPPREEGRRHADTRRPEDARRVEDARPYEGGAGRTQRWEHEGAARYFPAPLYDPSMPQAGGGMYPQMAYAPQPFPYPFMPAPYFPPHAMHPPPYGYQPQGENYHGAQDGQGRGRGGGGRGRRGGPYRGHNGP
ncbi:uncharacterized protein TRAVEDRAFT_46520 [Trametes versicolor FP-101664 SS1]|uniref:uncharacterized protein n=1 Tax=Trametes versicolor (strain FP-101664) TaxID=717944 RepID=UPI000462338A|nr:uncharacterized protein TRAVEDRAFT_46520 [Trametes versicolor FP-101664 SS1]EIW59216.1 hypothetical protein TRAVEDRAFT_46520 [Trametes versicolor FP-101664 SS1]